MRITLNNINRLINNPKLVRALFRGVKVKNYEDVLVMLKLLKKQPRTFIDVGCGCGDYIKTIKDLVPECKIYAFDPIPLHKDASIQEIALSDKNETQEFQIDRNQLGSSLFMHNGDTVRKTRVKCRRFDDLGLKIEKPCIIKIDVEGAELKVLRGFGAILKEIEIIQIEYVFDRSYNKTYDLGEVIKLLNGFGFYNFIQRAVRFRNEKPLNCDLIFWNKTQDI